MGDALFHERCALELFGKRRNRAMVIVSHEVHYITEHCDRACVLHEGRLLPFDRVDEALDAYRASTLPARTGTT